MLYETNIILLRFILSLQVFLFARSLAEVWVREASQNFGKYDDNNILSFIYYFDEIEIISFTTTLVDSVFCD